MNRRAQVGVEALIAVGIVFLILLATYAVYSGKQRELAVSSRDLAEYDDCLALSGAIADAYLLGAGGVVSVSVDVPLTVYATAQTIESEHTSCALTVDAVAANATGFTVGPGDILATHESAGVVVSDA